jgi:hypothetical protein
MRAADGQGAVCVITGEPGIGKTRLVERALASWKSQGFDTYAAAAWEMEQRRPFGLISDALRLRDLADGGRAAIGRLLRGGDSAADAATDGADGGAEIEAPAPRPGASCRLLVRPQACGTNYRRAGVPKHHPLG